MCFLEKFVRSICKVFMEDLNYVASFHHFSIVIIIFFFAGPMVLIGRCGTQKFASSAYSCQREMMTKLARADSGSCR